MHDFLHTLNIRQRNSGTCFANRWLAGKDTLASCNPTDGSVIATVEDMDAEAGEATVHAAAEAFSHWRMQPAPLRGEIVRQIGAALRKIKPALAQLVSLEMGKSLQEGLGEVQEMIDMADFAVGLSRQLYGLSMHSERLHHRMYEQWHPLGVVGVITAFNFPVAVWAWNAFLAAVCGNTVIWKPSSKTPLSAIAVQHVCNEITTAAGFPGIFSLCVMPDNKDVEKFIADRRIALVSFTGSTPVGRRVGTTVAQRLGRVLLEMGGNNAIIADSSADLKLTVPAVVFGALGTAGQRCTSTRRLFVHTDIYTECVRALVAAFGQIRIGDPLDPKNHMGPLIDADAVASYQQAMHAILSAGGKILFGGKVLDRPGFFVEPTLVLAENHWDIVQTETFAPILYIMKFANLDDAIGMQNHSSYGLSSAIFTNDLRNSEKFLAAHGSDCGIANVNIGTSGAEIGGAFGGEKATGGGREAGSDAWKQYMRRQTVTLNWGDDLPLAQGIRFEVG